MNLERGYTNIYICVMIEIKLRYSVCIVPKWVISSYIFGITHGRYAFIIWVVIILWSQSPQNFLPKVSFIIFREIPRNIDRTSLPSSQSISTITHSRYHLWFSVYLEWISPTDPDTDTEDDESLNRSKWEWDPQPAFLSQPHPSRS